MSINTDDCASGAASSDSRRSSTPKHIPAADVQCTSTVGEGRKGRRPSVSFENVPNLNETTSAVKADEARSILSSSAGPTTASNIRHTRDSNKASCTAEAVVNSTPSVRRASRGHRSSAAPRVTKRSRSLTLEAVALPTDGGAPSAICSSDRSSIDASAVRTEPPPLSRDPVSGSPACSPRSVDEAVSPTARGVARCNRKRNSSTAEHIRSPSRSGEHGRQGGGTTTASTTNGGTSAMTIPHPPVILTLQALARAHRSSCGFTTQARAMPAEGVFAPHEKTAPTMKAAAAAKPPAGSSAIARKHASPRRGLAPLDTTTLTSASATAAATAAATPNNVLGATKGQRSGPVSWTPNNTSTTTTTTAAAAAAASPTQRSGIFHAIASPSAATPGSRGTPHGQQRSHPGSTRGPALPRLSASFSPTSGVSGRANCVTDTNAPTNGDERVVSPSPGARSRAGGGSVEFDEPVMEICMFANSTVFQPMLPATLPVRRTSRGSTLSTADSNMAAATATTATSLTGDRTALTSVLLGSCSNTGAPPSCSATAVGSGGACASGTPSLFSQVKKSPHRRSCHPFLSRRVHSSSSSDRTSSRSRSPSPSVPRSAAGSTVNAPNAAFTSSGTDTTVIASSSCSVCGGGDTLMPTTCGVVCVAGAGEGASTRPHHRTSKLATVDSNKGRTTPTAPTTDAAATATSAESGLPSPASTVSSVALPFLRAPTQLAVSPLRSPPTPSPTAAQSKPPQRHGKSSPRPATTCSADRRLSPHSSSASSFLPPNDANLHSDHSSKSSDSMCTAATARRRSTSALRSPISAPLAPQMLAPPQLTPSSTPSSSAATTAAKAVTSPVCPPPPPPATEAAPEAQGGTESVTVHNLHVSNLLQYKKHEAAPTDSLNSRSGDREPAPSSSSAAHPGAREGGSGRAKEPSAPPSITELPPPRPAAHASSTPNDVLLTAPSKTLELTPQTRTELEVLGLTPAADYISVLQTSSTFATPFGFHESSSVLEDASICFGTFLHTQRFVSNSCNSVSRTPLNPPIANPRAGSSTDGVVCSPPRIAAGMSPSTGRSGGGGKTTTTMTNTTTPAAAASGGAPPRPHKMKSSASPVSLSVDDLLMSMLDAKSDEDVAAPAATAAGPVVPSRPSSPKPRPPGNPLKGSDTGSVALSHNSTHGVTVATAAVEAAGGDSGDDDRQPEQQHDADPLPPPPAACSQSSASSSGHGDDAARQRSNDTTNEPHAYPSIATFSAKPSHSTLPRETDPSKPWHSPTQSQLKSRARAPQPQPQLQQPSFDATGPRSLKDESRTSNSSSGNSNRCNDPLAVSTTQRPGTESMNSDSSVNSRGNGGAAGMNSASPKGASAPPTHRQETRNAVRVASPLKQRPRKRSSAVKPLNQSAAHPAQGAHCRSSKSPLHDSTDIQSSQRGSSSSSNKTAPGTANMAFIGVSHKTFSATQAFAEFPSQHDRHDDGNGERSATALLSVITADDGDARNSGATSTTGSQKRRHSLGNTVAKLWSATSHHGSSKSSAVASPAPSAAEVSPHTNAAAAPSTRATSTAATPDKTPPPPTTTTTTVTNSSASSPQKDSMIQQQALPALVSTFVAKINEEEEPGAAAAAALDVPSGASSRTARRSTDSSTSLSNAAVVAPTATPRQSSDRFAKRRQKSAEKYGHSVGEASMNRSDADTLPPQPVLHSREEMMPSPEKASKFVALTSRFQSLLQSRSTSSPSSRARGSSKGGSIRSSFDNAVMDAEGLRAFPLNSIVTSGSSNFMASRDCTQAPTPWHSVDRLVSAGDEEDMVFDHASPLALSQPTSQSASALLSSSSSASPLKSSDRPAAGRAAKGRKSLLSMTIIEKPAASGTARRASQSAQQVFKGAMNALQNKPRTASNISWMITAAKAGGERDIPALIPPPVQQQPQQPPSHRPCGGHGLFDALQAHQSINAAPTAPLYAGQGQATYQLFTGAAPNGMGHATSSSAPLPVPLPPRASDDDCGSHPGAAKLKSAGMHRARVAETQAPPTTPLVSLFPSTDVSADDGNDTASGAATSLSEVSMPPNTTALPRSGTSESPARARGAFSAGIAATWMTAAQALLPPSGHLTSLRVPLSAPATASGMAVVSAAAAPQSGVACGLLPGSAEQPRKRVFTSALHLSMPMDAPLLNANSEEATAAATAAAAATTGTGTGARASVLGFHSLISTTAGSFWRCAAPQAGTAIGLEPTNAGTVTTATAAVPPANAPSRWSLCSTSKRKWTSSMPSLNGSLHPHHGASAGNLLRAPSGSSPLLPQTTGSSPTSSQGVRRGFSSRKFGPTSSSGGSSRSSSVAGDNTSGSGSGGGGRRSAGKSKQGLQRQQSSTSAEGRRTGQVVLMDVEPSFPAEESRQLPPLMRAMSPIRNLRASLVSTGSSGDGASLPLEPQLNPQECSPPPHQRQLEPSARGLECAMNPQDAPRKSLNKSFLSAVQSIAGSRRSFSSDENWLAAILPSAEGDGDGGAPSLGWVSSAVSPEFAPSTISFMDFSMLSSGEGEHAQLPGKDVGADAVEPADKRAAAATTTSTAAPAAALSPDLATAQRTPPASQHGESHAKSILRSAHLGPHPTRNAASIRSSATTAAVLSPVSLSILLNSTSFDSNNGRASSGGGGHGVVTAAPGAAAATAVTAANAPLNAQLAAGGGFPSRPRPSRSSSPPPILLSCEAAPALFTMTSGFAALQLHDSLPLTVGRRGSGAAPPLSLDGSRDPSPSPPPARSPPPPLHANTDSQSGDGEKSSNIRTGGEGSGARLADASAAPSSPTATAAATMPAAPSPPPAPSARGATRHTRTLSYTGSNTAIPAPPATSLTTSGSGARSRLVGSLSAAPNSTAGGVPASADAGAAPRRGIYAPSHSHSSSGVSELMVMDVAVTGSSNASCSGNSPLASSILYVPPELRRGPEWRHLQKYISHNVAQLQQHDPPHLLAPSAMNDASAGHARSHASSHFAEGVPSVHGEKQGDPRGSTASWRATRAAQAVPLPPPTGAATATAAEATNTANGSGGQGTSGQRDQQQPIARWHSNATFSAHCPGHPQGAGPRGPHGSSPPLSSAPPSSPSPGAQLQLVRLGSLLSIDAPNNTNYSSSVASVIAHTLPYLPSQLPIFTTFAQAGKAEAVHGDAPQLRARVPSGNTDTRGPSIGQVSSGGGEAPTDLNSPAEARGGLSSPTAEPDGDNAQHPLLRLLVPPSSSEALRDESTLSGVLFIASESDDDDVSCEGSSTNSSPILLYGHSHRKGATTPRKAAAVKERSGAHAANFDSSLSFSFPSGKFASPAPAVGGRQLTALANLAHATAPSEVEAPPPQQQQQREDAEAPAAGLKSSHSINTVDANTAEKRHSRAGLTSFSASTRRVSSLRSDPTQHSMDRMNFSGATALQQASRTRYSITDSLERADSRGGSSKGDRRRSLRSPFVDENGSPPGGQQLHEGSAIFENPDSARYDVVDTSSSSCILRRHDTPEDAGEQHCMQGPPRMVQSPLQSAAAAARRRQSLQSRLAAANEKASTSPETAAVAAAPLPPNPPAAAVAALVGSSAPYHTAAVPPASTPSNKDDAGEVRGCAAQPQRPSPTGEARPRRQPLQSSRKTSTPTGGLPSAPGSATRSSDASDDAASARRRKSALSDTSEGCSPLLAFSPVAPDITETEDGVRHGDVTAKQEATAATASPTERSPPAADDGGHHNGAGGVSHVISVQRSSVGDVDEATTMKATAAASPSLSSHAAAAKTCAATNATPSSPPSSDVVRAASNTVQRPSGGSSKVAEASSLTAPPASRLAANTRLSLAQTSPGGGPAHPSGCLTKSPGKSHHDSPAVPTTATPTPFMLPNCAMMSSMELASQTESTITSTAASPDLHFCLTSVTGAVSVSGPLALSGGASGGMDDSLLTNATDENRTLMMLSAFPMRHTPLATPSLLDAAETGAAHNNGGGGGVSVGAQNHTASAGAGKTPVLTSDVPPTALPLRQVTSPNGHRGGRAAAGGGRGRRAGEAVVPSPPLPPSPRAGRTPSASTTSSSTTTRTTVSTNSNSGTSAQRQRLPRVDASSTTTSTASTTGSTSSHAAATPRWRAFTNLSSPTRAGVVMVHVGNTENKESPSARATPALPQLPHPPTKTQLNASSTTATSSSTASSATQHLAGH